MSKGKNREPVNLVVNPTFAGRGKTPDGWTFQTPRPALAPKHAWRRSGSTHALVLSATGDPHLFGCWRGQAPLTVGKWYHAAVSVRVSQIKKTHLALFVQVANHFLLPRGMKKGVIFFDQTFRHAAESDGHHFEFYLRAAEGGKAEWFNPRVEEIAPPQHRIARVATVRFGDRTHPLTLDQQRRRIADKLNEAGALKPDIVVLPEFSQTIGVDPREFNSAYTAVAETVSNGPVCKLLSAAAKQYRMYVLAGIIEKRGNYFFNTAVLYDRKGKLLGRYEKTHLTFGELEGGFSCGSNYPVFDLDFGRIGIHICYDEWFPEVARYYAHAGAEILFLPVAGGKPITWRTRALDNGLYFVSSSITPPSMIIDSSGVILAETHGDGIACANLTLDYREVNWYKDPTLTYGMPCIVPQMRNVLNDRLIESLPSQIKKYGDPAK